MTNEEAKSLKAGDMVVINGYAVRVGSVTPSPYRHPRGLFISTEHGDFHASVCFTVAEWESGCPTAAIEGSKAFLRLHRYD